MNTEGILHMYKINAEIKIRLNRGKQVLDQTPENEFWEERVHSYYNIDIAASKRNWEAGQPSAQRSAGTADRDPRDTKETPQAFCSNLYLSQ